MMEEDNQLLPCPFCGSKAKIFTDVHEKNVAIICQNKECLCNARIPYCRSVAEAIIQWNKRV